MPPIRTLLAAAAILCGAAAPPETGMARYDAAGHMMLPAAYRTWVFLSSGMDMSYTQSPAMADGHMFSNVFAPQAAYAAFLTTGTWPDGTVLMLESRGAAGNVSINKRGLVQTSELMGLEAHVKDTTRFKGGWAFFAFDNGKPAEKIPTTASCYACHEAHAAVDTSFVQFYPTLMPIATKHGTLSQAYLAETGAK